MWRWWVQETGGTTCVGSSGGAPTPTLPLQGAWAWWNSHAPHDQSPASARWGMQEWSCKERLPVLVPTNTRTPQLPPPLSPVKSQPKPTPLGTTTTTFPPGYDPFQYPGPGSWGSGHLWEADDIRKGCSSNLISYFPLQAIFSLPTLCKPCPLSLAPMSSDIMLRLNTMTFLFRPTLIQAKMREEEKAAPYCLLFLIHSKYIDWIPVLLRSVGTKLNTPSPGSRKSPSRLGFYRK